MPGRPGDHSEAIVWTGSALIGKIAGFKGIPCGASAFCLAMAEVLNEAKGRTVLLIGEPRKYPPLGHALGPLFGFRLGSIH